MNTFKIEIPKPCTADWDSMSPAERGKFCGACSKIVIDFTAMTTDEIKDYFLKHREQKICGHFITSQIKGSTGLKGALISLHKKTGGIRYRIPRMAAAFFILAIMTLAGCGPDEPEGVMTTTGDSIYYPVEQGDSMNRFLEKELDSINRANDSTNN